LKNLKGRDFGVDRRIILRLILKKWGVRCGSDLSGSGYEPVAGSYEHSNEPLGSKKEQGLFIS
jgi:hypothetical protein